MKKKIIIIGAGFAGIKLVKEINDELFDIMLIDKQNYHQFQPLLYQVATAQIEPSSISFPLRYIFRKKNNLEIRLAEVKNIQCKTNIVETSTGNFKFDILIIAIGCKSNFWANNQIEKFALPLKNLNDAINIRNHILTIFEKIVSSQVPDKAAFYNIVIVGAGPTGVELSGALIEIKKNILPKDYPTIDCSKLKIILVEGSKNTLSSMSIYAQKNSLKYLLKIGVEVITNETVTSYNGSILSFISGIEIETKTVIWSAGITGNPIIGLPPTSYTKSNRIVVNGTNLVKETQNIYAVGDIAFMQTSDFPKGHPQLANVAIKQAKNLAKNLNLMYQKHQFHSFKFADFGSMATIGKNKAIVDLKFLKIKGYLAWFIWMTLHLFLILGVRNKLFIFINWIWAYLNLNTPLRIILKDSESYKKQ